MERYDAIVLGLGGMGSAALYHLARRGLRVCGIEQFTAAHDRGSSHGHTRIIRRSYFEHPAYVPLVDASWALWEELAAETGTQLFSRVGLMLAGPGDGAIVAGVRRAAAEHDLAIEALSPSDAVARWLGFAFDDAMDVLFEPDAGYLRVEACVRAHLQAAELAGAVTRFGEAVTGWCAEGDAVRVTTSAGRLAADRLVICTGGWSGLVVPEIARQLRVIRKSVCWFANHGDMMEEAGGCPVFGFDTSDGFCYGFPAIAGRGVKVGNHTGGMEMVDPDCGLHDPADDELASIDRFRKRHLPGVGAGVGERSVCSYTMTADEHFVIDRHPEYANVVLACGFSGHGFKFAPIVGAILADLAIDGTTAHPVGLFSARRPGLGAAQG
ncbi:MAG: N-methyl-L-tryptophan oxidase [Phycisphaerales bacterium]|nr:N-methyl-L-tryptophan oxidase [Phycisphaerales bacterium]